MRDKGPLTSWPRETVARTRWAGGRPPRITFGPQNVCAQDGRPRCAGAPVGRGPGRQASGARGELRACVLAKGIDQLARGDGVMRGAAGRDGPGWGVGRARMARQRGGQGTARMAVDGRGWLRIGACGVQVAHFVWVVWRGVDQLAG